MTTSEAAEFFGGKKVMADRLGITHQAVYKWGDRPPAVRQFQIQVLSKGKLRADDIAEAA